MFFQKATGNTTSEIFDESRKLEAFCPPTFIRPAPPPLLNEDELIWLNPENFLLDYHNYMYDSTMCETKLVFIFEIFFGYFSKN